MKFFPEKSIEPQMYVSLRLQKYYNLEPVPEGVDAIYSGRTGKSIYRTGSYSVKYKKPFDLPEVPLTLSVITYHSGKPIGHLITLSPEELKRR